MKQKLITTISVLALLIFACKKKPEPVDHIRLIQPVNAIANPITIKFEWETDQSEVFFELFEDGNQLILDTLTFAKEFTVKHKTYPGTTYRWRITANNEFREATFSTRDILGEFAGIHNVTATKECWAISVPPPPCDTVFETQLELIKNGKEVIMREAVSGLDKSNFFYPYNNDSVLFYIFPYSNGSNVMLNIYNDSIHAEYCNCGLGGGVRWKFFGKKH